MKPSNKPRRLVLALVGVGVCATVLLMVRETRVQRAREVRTRAWLYMLSGHVALSGSRPFLSDTDSVLSVLKLQDDELVVLTDSGIRVRNGQVLDAWGNPITLTIVRNQACLRSLGPNERRNTGGQADDDIVDCFPLARLP